MFGISIGFDENGHFIITTSTGADRNKRDKGNSLLLIPSDYTVIDIETTGFDCRFCDIIEMGAVRVRNNEPVESFQSLVHISEPLDEYITSLTGITDEMLATAPELKDVLTKFLAFVGDDVLLGHNVNFDVNFIYDSVENEFGQKFNNDFIDTLRLSRRISTEFKTHKLEYLCTQFGIRTSGHHRVLADCEATICLLNRCKSAIEEKGIDLSYYAKARQLKASDVVAAEGCDPDETSFFFNRQCVFTGTLSRMNRKDAMQLVVNIGGTCGDNVTDKTDYLIMGIQDYRKFTDGQQSSKTKKAYKMMDNGHHIQIISEEEFYKYVLNDAV